MTAQKPVRTRLERHQDKSSAISAFVSRQMTYTPNGINSTTDLSVIAVSINSPIVSAVRTAIAENTDVACSIRLVLATQPDTLTADAIADLAPIDIRWADNPRLMDAHEQLVIADTASWIGDCMRRDPEKRDAYESFNSDCLEAVGWARISFERIWDASQPLMALDDARRTPRTGLSEDTTAALRASVNRIRDAVRSGARHDG